MLTRWGTRTPCLLLLFFMALTVQGQKTSCTNCHQDRRHGQQSFHTLPCVTCHAGNQNATSKQHAHQELIAFPGNLSNVNQTCGQCHQEQVQSVHGYAMTTARGMVATTRQVLGDSDDGADITQIGHSLSDSLLRKLCAGCHLRRDRETHTHSTLIRGGGCLACHLDEYPESGHVRLTRTISDARCFGCHSRSGRISMNYAGLAEFDASGVAQNVKKARLPDGRQVQLRAPDVHHRAGMSCIDCHTRNGLMGTQNQGPVEQGIDIQCMDCHRPTTDVQGYAISRRMHFRLEHVRHTDDEIQLTLKQSNKPIPVPLYSKDSHPHEQEHARLSCDACHAQWAPLCYGCHVEYDADSSQYDHLEKQATPGKWQETRWLMLSDLPPLGVDANNQIRPFVPGMILTLDHPDLDQPLFRRLFAPLAPHTTGKARSCQSCHCNPLAFGLGSGVLEHTAGGWTFIAEKPALKDGLAEDAWQQWNHLGMGASTQINARPLNKEEIHRMLTLCR